LILSKEKESPAARAGEIDGTDKRDCHEKNDGGEQSEDDHCDLLKMLERGVQAENQSYVLCFQQVAMQEVCREVAESGQLLVQVHSNRVLGLARPNQPTFPFPRGIALTLAQPNRAITGVNRQRLAAPIHFAVNLRIAEGSFHSNGDPQADVPVARAGVDVGLKV
jgi:hypothetical protein